MTKKNGVMAVVIVAGVALVVYGVRALDLVGVIVRMHGG
jgi:hypothetical protein